MVLYLEKLGNSKMEAAGATGANAEDSELQLERGILTNFRTYSAVFEKIFMKYGREFDENEDGGGVIDLTTSATLEKGITKLKNGIIPSTPVELQNEADILITGESTLDPEQTAQLHERVVRIKKEINWSKDELEEDEVHLNSLQSQEYIDISSCSDTCDSDFEEELPSVPIREAINSSETSNLVLMRPDPLLETSTNISPSDSTHSTSVAKYGHSPVVRVRKAFVHKRRATEPQRFPPSNPVSLLKYDHLQTENSHSNSFAHSSHPHCCIWPAQAQSDCDCPSCRWQQVNVCKCQSCSDVLPNLPDRPTSFYIPQSTPCSYEGCGNQQSVMNSSASLSQSFNCQHSPCCSPFENGRSACEETGTTGSSLDYADYQDLRRGKRQLEDYSSTSVTKKPCV